MRCGWSGPLKPSCFTRPPWGSMDCSPGSPSPWTLGQAWGGELGGRSTGAKALLCLTAEIMLTGEKEKTLVVWAAAAGRDMEEAAASGGLEGMTPGRGREGQAQQGRQWETQQGDSTRVSSQSGPWQGQWAPCGLLTQAPGSDLPGGCEGPGATSRGQGPETGWEPLGSWANTRLLGGSGDPFSGLEVTESD